MRLIWIWIPFSWCLFNTSIDNPSDRDIYWIVGEAGNEGKTFIQKYIQQLFGARHVLKTEANSRKADIAYTFGKH